jgi:hypothetical protein
MKTRIVIGSLIMMFVLSLSATAGAKNDLQKYFNDTAKKVKAADNPTEKRTILTSSFQTMSKALDMVRRSPMVSKEDGIGIDRLKMAIQEKQDELAGSNGLLPVTDQQLNAFSDYVVQDMEQADQTITISVVTALLILILVVLLVK